MNNPTINENSRIEILNKIFILGLPRTGTTSLCHLLLQHHYTVAHTAFTEAAFDQAEVIADTPVFSDFYELNKLYPNSRWIYLYRNFNDWLPSITVMLNKLRSQPNRRFHPLILRSFQRVFGDLNNQNITDPKHLEQCYNRHARAILEYQRHLNKALISVELQHGNSINTDAITKFLAALKPADTHPSDRSTKPSFFKLAIPPRNQQGKITAWKTIQHPNKIPSHLAKNGRRNFFNYGLETDFNEWN